MMSEAALARHEFLNAVELASRASAISPPREDALSVEMIALCQLGRRSEALIRYRDCEVYLRREVRCRPDPLTSRLEERLRHGDCPTIREAQTEGEFDRYRVGLHHLCLEAYSRSTVDERADWLREVGDECGLHQLAVQRGDAVDGVAADDREVRHADLPLTSLEDQRHVTLPAIVSRPASRDAFEGAAAPDKRQDCSIDNDRRRT